MREVKSFYVTEGSTAISPQEIPWEDNETRKRREKREAERARVKRRNAHQMAMRYNGIMTLYLVFGVLVIAVIFFALVHLHTGIQESMKNISVLESELTTIRANNDATASRIETSTNLTIVRNRAAQEMGMHYANGDQIRYYELDGSDYMTLYEQIP